MKCILYEFVCKCKKTMGATVILSLILVLSGCQNKEDTIPYVDDNEELIVSVFDNEGKGKRRLHASLSGNKQYLAFTSAKGDGPWEIYLLEQKR